MRKTRVFGIGLAAVALLGALFGLFWTLDFYLGQAQTQVNASVTTVSNAAGRAELAQSSGTTLRVFVAEDDPFGRGLRDELCRQLAAGPLFASVVPGEQTNGMEANVLAVRVGNRHVRWSGVYSNAEINLELYYSTLGGEPFPKPGTAIELGAGKVGLVVHGDYDLADTTVGLISLPGYGRELGKRAGAELAKSLTAQIQAQRS